MMIALLHFTLAAFCIVAFYGGLLAILIGPVWVVDRCSRKSFAVLSMSMAAAICCYLALRAGT